MSMLQKNVLQKRKEAWGFIEPGEQSSHRETREVSRGELLRRAPEVGDFLTIASFWEHRAQKFNIVTGIRRAKTNAESSGVTATLAVSTQEVVVVKVTCQRPNGDTKPPKVKKNLKQFSPP